MSKLLIVLSGLVAAPCLAYSGGISGHSQSGCSGCHSGGGTPSVTLSGPTTVTPGSTNQYSLVITGGAGSCGGLDVAAAGATLSAGGPNEKLLNGDVTNSSAASFSGSSLTYTFSALAGSGSSFTIHAAGLSGCSTGNSDSAQTSLSVTIQSASAQPPTITQAAQPASANVSAASVGLSVQASDPAGGSLTYSWSATGPGNVSFSPNGDGSSANTTATFTAAGTYAMTVTVNGSGGNVTSNTSVTVTPTESSLSISPPMPAVAPGATMSFSASAADQFGAPMGAATGVSWGATGDGTIDGAGNFTAGGQAGTATVTATTSSLSGSTTVTITNNPPPPPPPPAPPPTIGNGGVVFLEPPPGVKLAGIVLLRVAAADPSGISSVTFMADQSNLMTVSGVPYEIRYDTTLLPDGTHTLTAVATASSGKQWTATLPVEIRNGNLIAQSGCSASGGGAWILATLLVLAAAEQMRRAPRRCR